MNNNYYSENSKYFEKSNTDFPENPKSIDNNNYDREQLNFEDDHYKKNIAKKIKIGYVNK